MSPVPTGTIHFPKALDRMKADAASGTVWLWPVRSRGMQRFLRDGLPGRGDEAWRFTDLRRLRDRDFVVETAPVTIDEARLAESLLPALPAHRAVLLNGRFEPHRSELGEPEPGVLITSLRNAVDAQHAVLSKHLGAQSDLEAAPFAALNDAGFVGGLFVHVPAGVRCHLPVHLLSFSGGVESLLVQHRVLVVAEEGAEVTILEHHVGTEGSENLRNSLTEIVAGPRARVRHVTLVREGDLSTSVSTVCVRQEAGSEVRAHAVLLGGAVARHEVRSILAGEGASTHLRSLMLARGSQQQDTWVRLEHAAPNCTSRQMVKSLAADEGRAVFTGRIVVDRAGQGTDAQQTCRNLLLSDHARTQTQPQLEIHADDVRCTHGATTGRLDELARFYLRSRGIPDESARALLLGAFAAEPLADLQGPALRRFVLEEAFRRLGLDPALAGEHET